MTGAKISSITSTKIRYSVRVIAMVAALTASLLGGLTFFPQTWQAFWIDAYAEFGPRLWGEEIVRLRHVPRLEMSNDAQRVDPGDRLLTIDHTVVRIHTNLPGERKLVEWRQRALHGETILLTVLDRASGDTLHVRYIPLEQPSDWWRTLIDRKRLKAGLYILLAWAGVVGTMVWGRRFPQAAALAAAAACFSAATAPSIQDAAPLLSGLMDWRGAFFYACMVILLAEMVRPGEALSRRSTVMLLFIGFYIALKLVYWLSEASTPFLTAGIVWGKILFATGSASWLLYALAGRFRSLRRAHRRTV
ncbi:hypothetical protein GF324_14060 [bacterium]|nr:hypothetical protein [bacterium]